MLPQVFSGDILNRLPQERSVLLDSGDLPASLVAHLREMEELTNYTIFLIRVKEKNSLVSELDNIKQELANIYHFYLHPEELPDTIIGRATAYVCLLYYFIFLS